MTRLVRIILAVVAVVVAGACGSTGNSSAPASTSSPRLMITSTLTGRSVLPHRIHWVATPSAPAADILAVDYSVDGKQLWVEHNTPYDYGGYTRSYLVTSFLKPGVHRFTVKVVTVRGKTASQTVTATVPTAPPPPAALAGTWRALLVNTGGAGSPPTGYWRLVINRVGWQIYDTAGTGDLLDVVYPSPGLLEVYTGMNTGHPNFDANGWCSNAPGTPVRYHWSANGGHLTMRPAGGHGCPGFRGFMTSHWSAAH
jgi:hypothetical protein